ncbi:hypothetical protein BLOT_005863 [Blomia tropicalis]|nr:hypothetical protein BLOT_005863 [Blomia tropicalis]
MANNFVTLKFWHLKQSSSSIPSIQPATFFSTPIIIDNIFTNLSKQTENEGKRVQTLCNDRVEDEDTNDDNDHHHHTTYLRNLKGGLSIVSSASYTTNPTLFTMIKMNNESYKIHSLKERKAPPNAPKTLLMKSVDVRGVDVIHSGLTNFDQLTKLYNFIQSIFIFMRKVKYQAKSSFMCHYYSKRFKSEQLYCIIIATLFKYDSLGFILAPKMLKHMQF